MCVPVGGLLATLATALGVVVAFAPAPRITWEHGGKGPPALGVDRWVPFGGWVHGRVGGGAWVTGGTWGLAQGLLAGFLNRAPGEDAPLPRA